MKIPGMSRPCELPCKGWTDNTKLNPHGIWNKADKPIGFRNNGSSSWDLAGKFLTRDRLNRAEESSSDKHYGYHPNCIGMYCGSYRPGVGVALVRQAVLEHSTKLDELVCDEFAHHLGCDCHWRRFILAPLARRLVGGRQVVARILRESDLDHILAFCVSHMPEECLGKASGRDAVS